MQSRRNLLIACLFVACILLHTHTTTLVQAHVETGTLSSTFSFAGKFCFGEGTPAGSLVATVNVPLQPWMTWGSLHTDYVLLNYDDEPAESGCGNWNALLDHWDTWTCKEKIQAAKGCVTVDQWNGDHPHQIEIGTEEAVLSWTVDIKDHVRPRYWYFSFANCNYGLENLQYKLHFTQANENAWNREFGTNEYGLGTLYLVFFLLFTIIFSVYCLGMYRLQKRLSYVHPIMKLFLGVLLFEYVSIFLSFLHYSVYANDGVGMAFVSKLGELCAILSRAAFMMLLLLLARGWTISNERLRHKKMIIALVTSYLIFSLVLFTLSYTMNDVRRTTPNELIAGLHILLVGLWAIFAGLYCVQVFQSWRKEDPNRSQAKRTLYMRLGVIFGLWFILLPATSLAVFTLDPWNRERVVAAMTVSVTTFAHAVLVYLFWPSRAEEYFSIATPDKVCNQMVRLNGREDGEAEEEYNKL